MNYNITLNATKLIALLVLLLGTAVTIILKDPTVFTATLGVVTALLVNRDYQDRIKQTK